MGRRPCAQHSWAYVSLSPACLLHSRVGAPVGGGSGASTPLRVRPSPSPAPAICRRPRFLARSCVDHTFFARVQMATTVEAEIAVKRECGLGEGSVWDYRVNKLLWLDILNAELFRRVFPPGRKKASPSLPRARARLTRARAARIAPLPPPSFRAQLRPRDGRERGPPAQGPRRVGRLVGRAARRGVRPDGRPRRRDDHRGLRDVLVLEEGAHAPERVAARRGGRALQRRQDRPGRPLLGGHARARRQGRDQERRGEPVHARHERHGHQGRGRALDLERDLLVGRRDEDVLRRHADGPGPTARLSLSLSLSRPRGVARGDGS